MTVGENLSRWVFVLSLALVVLGGAFGFGALAYRNDLPPIPQLRLAYATLFKAEGLTTSAADNHLQPARGQGAGVVKNSTDDDARILLAGFFDGENQIRLIERDGSVVRKWPLDYFAHFPDTETRPCVLQSELYTDTHGALMTPQGEIVFNYDYCGTVKLDQCGAVAWTIEEPTHHSVIAAEAGGYWVLGRYLWAAAESPERFTPFTLPAGEREMQDDTLMRVSETGEILDEFSIPQMMVDNGLEALLTATGENFLWDVEPRVELIHSNKAAELTSDIAGAFPLFAAGDIALSMRELNLVMVIDPVTRRVKWHQTGPWLRQHDPEFRPDGLISIFNNNVYRTAYVAGQTNLDAAFDTNIMTVDPVSGATQVVFGQQPGEEMLSVIRGQHELLPDGGMLITEFDAGRVLQVSPDRQIVWEYVNHYSAEKVGEITNAALYPADYVHTGWRDCG